MVVSKIDDSNPRSKIYFQITGCCLNMTHNVQGLAMWRYSLLRQPERMLSKDNKDENIF